MKLAIVVQRYGADISGGAELHARYIAERLSAHVDVRVLTTCARDYLTWRNEFPSGTEYVNGVPVERFPVLRTRDLNDFGLRQQRVFGRVHTLNEELDWLESQGPVSPGLITRLRRSVAEFDFALLFCARYYQTYYGARVAADRAVLVPTAEREPALPMRALPPSSRSVAATPSSKRTEICSRRAGRSIASSARRSSARFAGLARTISWLPWPVSVPPGSRSGCSAGRTCSAVR